MSAQTSYWVTFTVRNIIESKVWSSCTLSTKASVTRSGTCPCLISRVSKWVNEQWNLALRSAKRHWNFNPPPPRNTSRPRSPSFTGSRGQCASRITKKASRQLAVHFLFLKTHALQETAQPHSHLAHSIRATNPFVAAPLHSNRLHAEERKTSVPARWPRSPSPVHSFALKNTPYKTDCWLPTSDAVKFCRRNILRPPTGQNIPVRTIFDHISRNLSSLWTIRRCRPSCKCFNTPAVHISDSKTHLRSFICSTFMHVFWVNMKNAALLSDFRWGISSQTWSWQATTTQNITCDGWSQSVSAEFCRNCRR